MVPKGLLHSNIKNICIWKIFYPLLLSQTMVPFINHAIRALMDPRSVKHHQILGKITIYIQPTYPDGNTFMWLMHNLVNCHFSFCIYHYLLYMFLIDLNKKTYLFFLTSHLLSVNFWLILLGLTLGYLLVKFYEILSMTCKL